jgi:hypothetical protein
MHMTAPRRRPSSYTKEDSQLQCVICRLDSTNFHVGGGNLSWIEHMAHQALLSRQSSSRITYRVSRGQVVYPARPDSTAVVKGSSTSDVLLLLKTERMMVTEVEDEG